MYVCVFLRLNMRVSVCVQNEKALNVGGWGGGLSSCCGVFKKKKKKH